MCTVTELVPELWLPCGSTALFHAVHDTVFTPSPFDGQARRPDSSARRRR